MEPWDIEEKPQKGHRLNFVGSTLFDDAGDCRLGVSEEKMGTHLLDLVHERLLAALMNFSTTWYTENVWPLPAHPFLTSQVMKLCKGNDS